MWVWLVSLLALVLAITALVLCLTRRGRRGRRGPAGGTVKGPPQTLGYYLSISDFIASFVEIPTSNVSSTGTTIDSSYLGGRAPLFDSDTDLLVGTCSATFFNQQTAQGIFTDISNFIQTVDGLIITWFTPTTLINLALDSIVNGMVTEAIVTVTTKVGASRYFGHTYDMTVSSDGTDIHFVLVSTNTT